MDQAADWLFVPHSCFKQFFGLPVFVIAAESCHRLEPSDQFVFVTYFHNIYCNTKSKWCITRLFHLYWGPTC